MKLFLIPFLLLLPSYVFSNENNGTIRGTVSTSDGMPAAFVSVRIENSGKGDITDDQGNFEIKKLSPGNCILRFSLLGYVDSTINVHIKQNETTFITVQLDQTYAELKKITVVANLDSKHVEIKPSESLRLNLPLNEIPQNIAVVTHQTMADQGLLSTTEATRNVSGVEKINGGLNDYSLIIRGTDATYNVVRNGVGNFWWNQQEDAAMLEKIELIKGPAGFMMSEAEPGGIVNIVTKQPSKESISNINVGFGSYNMIRLTADIGGTFSKSSKFSYRFNAGVHRQNRSFQFGTASRYFVCAAVKYDLTKKISFTAEYNLMKAETKGNNTDLPSIDGKMLMLPRNFAVADASTDKVAPSDNYFRIHFKHIFNDNWQLNAQLAYIDGSYIFHWLQTDPSLQVTNDTLYRYVNHEEWRNFSKVAQFFFDGKFKTTAKIEHKLLLGIDCYSAGTDDQIKDTYGQKKFGLYIPRPQYYLPVDSLRNTQFSDTFYQKVRFNNVTIYLQDHIKIAEKLVITLAGHFTHATFYDTGTSVPDYQKNNIYNVVTPRMGLTWLFTKDISIYAMYDQSFAPEIAPVYNHTPLRPLTGSDIEAGMKAYFFDKKLNINFSVFQITKNNTLSADPAHPGFNIQTGQVTSKGIEVDINGNITHSLTIAGNYAYTDARITKDSSGLVGLRIFGTPDHYANLWLKYIVLHHKSGGLSFAIGYQHMGKRSAVDPGWASGDPVNYLPVYNLFDAALSYSINRFNICLNVYNLTNTDYAAMGYFNSAIKEWRYTPGEPINFRLSIGINLVHLKKSK
ncbi:TonB-dependent receptor [Danxiaibacter flavus]|uniref:TonB-dependent receptor n=1 Tax=Danxiaibacter flavus TaxID=3049108 RepID=A0ABV3ZJ08_9BACT|nr:TonB-dependent receptor [Chitinophagaceae bacterium DXS]